MDYEQEVSGKSQRLTAQLLCLCTRIPLAARWYPLKGGVGCSDQISFHLIASSAVEVFKNVRGCDGRAVATAFTLPFIRCECVGRHILQSHARGLLEIGGRPVLTAAA